MDEIDSTFSDPFGWSNSQAIDEYKQNRRQRNKLFSSSHQASGIYNGNS